MPKLISIFNQCGGVAKTTLTLNLGYHLAQRQNRVLLVDVDPQSSLTTFMGIESTDLTETLYEAIMLGIEAPVIKNIHGVDLLPANINLSGAEPELVVADMREVRLKDALFPIQDNYDFILMDCPPSLGQLSYISLVAATHVLIPIQTHYKALIGVEVLLTKTIPRVRSRANPDLVIAGFIPTLHESRTGQGESSLQSIKKLSKVGEVFRPIPRAIAFADSVQAHLPLALFAPKHPAIEILTEIAQKLEQL